MECGSSGLLMCSMAQKKPLNYEAGELMIKRPCYSLVYIKVSCACSRGVDVPMCPWQVSWLPV